MILANYCENMNSSKPIRLAKPVRLLDFAINEMLNLMLRADTNLKKSNEPSNMMVSSESESENGNNNVRETFKATIDEYLGNGEEESRWHRGIIQARVNNHSNFVPI